MIEVVIIYIVLGFGSGYVVKKGTEVYLHTDDNNTKRYEVCVKAADSVNECTRLE